VVITKGAGRVSEVSARFVLDAMPGKQMAIDADLNAGLLTPEEAKARRVEVGTEAEFYGSMDGASKFVKGDAVAVRPGGWSSTSSAASSRHAQPRTVDGRGGRNIRAAGDRRRAGRAGAGFAAVDRGASSVTRVTSRRTCPGRLPASSASRAPGVRSR
jgi:hypothetical protein